MSLSKRFQRRKDTFMKRKPLKPKKPIGLDGFSPLMK